MPKRCLTICLFLFGWISVPALAQKILWARQLASEQAVVRAFGFYPSGNQAQNLIFKSDKNLLLGRTQIPVADSSRYYALEVQEDGTCRFRDTVAQTDLSAVPALSENRWILRTRERNGNYFLAYGLSTPMRLPSNLSWSLAYLDGNGHRLWEKHLPENQQIHQILLLPDGRCLLVGAETSERGDQNILVSLWNEYGKEVWTRSLGGKSDDEALSACQDGEERIYVGGYFSPDSSFMGNTRDLSGREKDGFIACYDLKGNQQFFYRQRGEGFNSVHHLAMMPLGRVLFAGTLAGKDWRLAPFGLPKMGKQDVIIGLIDPRTTRETEQPLVVFPNPVKEVLYFGLDKSWEKGPLKAQLHQKDGTVLQEMKISGSPGSSFRFNVSNTPPGAYFLSLKAGKKTLSQRVVVE